MKKGKQSFWTKNICFLAEFSFAELGGTPPLTKKIRYVVFDSLPNYNVS